MHLHVWFSAGCSEESRGEAKCISCILCMQDRVKHLLARADISTGHVDSAGNSLGLLTLWRRSFDQLPSDDHR